MNPNLVPITTTERARELGSKGGKVVSAAKKLAARLRELKKRGAVDNDTDILDITQAMEDANMSSLDIYLTLKDLKTYATKENKIGLLQSVTAQLMLWHKMHHGDAGASKIEVNIDARSVTYEDFNQIYEATQPDTRGVPRQVSTAGKGNKGKRRKKDSKVSV